MGSLDPRWETVYLLRQSRPRQYRMLLAPSPTCPSTIYFLLAQILLPDSHQPPYCFLCLLLYWRFLQTVLFADQIPFLLLELSRLFLVQLLFLCSPFQKWSFPPLLLVRKLAVQKDSHSYSVLLPLSLKC